MLYSTTCFPIFVRTSWSFTSKRRDVVHLTAVFVSTAVLGLHPGHAHQPGQHDAGPHPLHVADVCCHRTSRHRDGRQWAGGFPAEESQGASADGVCRCLQTPQIQLMKVNLCSSAPGRFQRDVKVLLRLHGHNGKISAVLSFPNSPSVTWMQHNLPAVDLKVRILWRITLMCKTYPFDIKAVYFSVHPCGLFGNILQLFKALRNFLLLQSAHRSKRAV